jgi:hypothetical protein
VAIAGGQMLDLSNKAAKGNTVTSVGFTVATNLGNVATFSSAATGSKILFSGKPTAANTVMTMAAMFYTNQTNAQNPVIFQTSSNNTASVGYMLVSHGNTIAQLLLQDANFANIISSGFAIANNIPYFTIVSTDHATATNFLLMNLNNGRISTATKVAATATGVLAGNGIYSVGGNSTFTGNQLEGGIATLMFSNTYMNIPNMLKWAEDPWAFWYPKYQDDIFSELVGVTGVADVLYAQIWA